MSMGKVKILRLEENRDCIRGVVLVDGQLLCCTLERPYINNERNVSAIPEGIYKAVAVHSPKFGRVYEITDVPGRTNILIHAGNTADDTEGCIILGKEFGIIKGERAVFRSREAIAELKEVLNNNPFELEIKRV